ncbi:MAG: HTTM domain-containing protein, partial [Bdellovibrionales bacterium]|nr:HTTM domain-containing protein [Bdellovibrionales bacterium]
MSRLHSAYQNLNRFWFDDVSLYPFVLCRIAIGLLLIHCYAVYFADRLWVVFGPGGLGSFLAGTPWFATSNSVFVASYAALLFAAVSFTLGFSTRVSGILLIFLHHEFVELGALATWGWKWEILPFLNCLVLAPSGARYSIDAWWRQRRDKNPAPETTAAWPLRLMQLHLSAMYLAAAWQRLDDPNWLAGSMVFAAMTNMIFSRFPNIEWFGWKGLLAFFNYAALVLEVVAPILLWHKKWGSWCVGALIVMHIGLEAGTM